MNERPPEGLTLREWLEWWEAHRDQNYVFGPVADQVIGIVLPIVTMLVVVIACWSLR